MAGTLTYPELEFPALPSEDDLPSSDGVPLESNWHVLQSTLLRHTVAFHWTGRRDYFAGGNMFLYFNGERLLDRDFRGPDFFIALGVRWRQRKSWVVWEEGKGPDVIVELLSDSTRDMDRTVKKQVYQNELRVPEYFWYDPETRELAGFVLLDGVYVPIPPDANGRLPSAMLGLSLGTWSGMVDDIEDDWIRWWTPDGRLLPSGAEEAEAERRKADVLRHNLEGERQRADAEQARADRLAQRLRALGLNLDE